MDNKEKTLSILSYLLIFALVPIFWKNKSPELKSHANSGIILLLLWVILLFVFQIPFLGVLVGLILLLAMLVFTVWGIYDAATGQSAKVPGVEKLLILFG